MLKQQDWVGFPVSALRLVYYVYTCTVCIAIVTQQAVSYVLGRYQFLLIYDALII